VNTVAKAFGLILRDLITYAAVAAVLGAIVYGALRLFRVIA